MSMVVVLVLPPVQVLTKIAHPKISLVGVDAASSSPTSPPRHRSTSSYRSGPPSPASRSPLMPASPPAGGRSP
eukprot:12283155-Heterocapsa_arctica.AAC.1